MMWLWQKRAIEIMVNLIVAVRPIWRTRGGAFEPRIASAA